jgi:hypothetical protein
MSENANTSVKVDVDVNKNVGVQFYDHVLVYHISIYTYAQDMAAGGANSECATMSAAERLERCLSSSGTVHWCAFACVWHRVACDWSYCSHAVLMRCLYTCVCRCRME